MGTGPRDERELPGRLGEASVRLRRRARAARPQATLRGRLALLWRLAPAILQTAVAASGAWVLASEVFGHAQPFFAPVGAVIALGVVLTERLRRATEIVLGVALGVLVADLIVIWLGAGPVQIAVVVALAMAVAVAAGGSRTIVGQAATSAVLVATIDVPDSVSLERAVDALAGGVTALAVGLVLLPLSPRVLVGAPLRTLAGAVADALDGICAALDSRDGARVLDTVEAARGLQAPLARYEEAAAVAAEVAQLAPLRRGQRVLAARHAVAATHLEAAVRNVRGIARAAVRAVDLDAHVPPTEHEALRALAEAVRALPDEVDGPGGGGGAASEAALRAARLSTASLELTGNMSLSVLTGLIRSAAADVLRALGAEGRDARQAVRAAGSADTPAPPRP